ncbi:MAG: amidase family protein [Myxococcales bacterium]|nr:amidase family protein [Myxococcales bacterium]
MAGFEEYDAYDGLGLAELVRAGQVRSRELVEECIARIERVNPKINGVVRPLYDRARAQSQEALGEGPFAGVPFLVKDLIQCIPGVPTEMGSVFWKGWTPQTATNLYKRWREAGVIPVGKTATSELGLLPVVETELCGKTRNPWNLDRTSGGSSGGSGASVAAGVAPLASAGDGGGSIRIPASCCGVFGHKPSRARNPVGPTASEHWSGFVSEHVVSRSVRDSAAMLDATHGPDATAPYFAPPIEGTFLGATKSDPRPLRIAFHSEPAFPSTVHPDCRTAVEDAAHLCEQLGHRVEEISPGHDPPALSRALVIVFGSNIAAEIEEAERIVGRRATPKDFQLTTWISHMIGKAVSAQDFLVALRSLQAEARRLARVYRDYDLVLTPTLGTPPIEIGALEPQGIDAAAQKLFAATGWSAPLASPKLIDRAAETTFAFVPFTPIANITGQPSMSVPLFWNAKDLPIGVMFTGRPPDEAVMFSLAAQLERARPWRDRRPPVYAKT